MFLDLSNHFIFFYFATTSPKIAHTAHALKAKNNQQAKPEDARVELKRLICF